MNQFVSLFEFFAIATLFVLGYAFIKTIIETIKNK